MSDGTVKRIRMSEAWWPAMLGQLRVSGNVTKSAEMAGISRQTYYHSYQQYPDFAAMADDALEQFRDSLEYVALTRALDGSDRMLELLLRANLPSKYRERSDIHQTVTHDYRVEIGSPYVPAQISQDDDTHSYRIITPSESILE
jgi:hypothetical protein